MCVCVSMPPGKTSLPAASRTRSPAGASPGGSRSRPSARTTPSSTSTSATCEESSLTTRPPRIRSRDGAAMASVARAAGRPPSGGTGRAPGAGLRVYQGPAARGRGRRGSTPGGLGLRERLGRTPRSAGFRPESSAALNPGVRPDPRCTPRFFPSSHWKGKVLEVVLKTRDVCFPF